MSIARIIGMLVILATTASAAADGWTIRVNREVGRGPFPPITPGSPTREIKVYATFTDAYAFAKSNFILSASEGTWANVQHHATWMGSVTTMGNSALSVGVFNLQYPQGGVFAPTGNPLLVLSATWVLTDYSPTPRNLYFSTATQSYHVYENYSGSSEQRFNIQEALATRQVKGSVPTPGPVALAGVVAAGLLRRRRRA
jgi:MYXO-CTERM domain-containing protein